MPKRVLVVEDNLALRAVVRFNLQQAGFEIVVVANGVEALRTLGLQALDLVVTDQQMPEMTGLELCRRMRLDPRLAITPVILLTAKGFELDADLLRSELGVARLMFKPFSPRELVAAVHECLAAVEANASQGEAVPSP